MQLPLNIDWQQILLHALNLVLLVAGLYFLLFKPVKHFMDAREARYEQMRSDAADAQAKADQLRADYETRLKEVDAEIDSRRQAALAEAEKQAEAVVEAARQESEKILAKARRSAESEKQRVMHNAQGEITKLSVEAARKLVDKPLSNVYDQFLDATEGRYSNDR